MLRRGDKLSAKRLNDLPADVQNADLGTIPVWRGGFNSIPTCKNQSGAGIRIEYLPKLPAIRPNRKNPRFVFWCSRDTWSAINPNSQVNGTGDDQVWIWWPKAAYYVPAQKYSSLSGVPETQGA